MKLWQRYFFLEMLRMFLLTCGAFYLLFVVIDYSLHTKLFGLSHIPIWQTLGYYLAQFSKRAILLIPFSLLLATIKVLTTLTLKGETVALLSSGVPMRRLLAPLLVVASLGLVFLYSNTQFLYPAAVQSIDRFEARYFHRQKTEKGALNIFPLADDSRLIAPASEGNLRDVYWLRGPKDIVHIEELHLGRPSIGCGIDFLTRAEDGSLTLSKTVEEAPMPDLSLPHGHLPKPLAPPDELSLTALVKQFPDSLSSDYSAQIATAFHQKIALPLICILVVLAPAPFCLSFSRQKPVFFIYALSITAFLCLTTLLDAAAILGEHQTLTPSWAIWTPLLLSFALFGGRQFRLGRI